MTGAGGARWRWTVVAAATLLGGLTLGAAVGLATRSRRPGPAGSPGSSGSVTAP